MSNVFVSPHTALYTRVSAAADRPARRTEAQHMLNILYHMIASYGNQNVSSTRPSCWIQMVGVINSCPTTITHLWHSPAK